MKLVDLTRVLNNGVYYKQRAQVEVKTQTNGVVNESGFTCSSMHIGTHIDLPSHFSGKPYQGEEAFIFPKDKVLFVKYKDLGELAKSSNIEVLIIDFVEEDLRSSDTYPFTFSAINPSELEHIISCFNNLRILGTSNPSIGNPQDSSANKFVHEKLLVEKGILALEDVKVPFDIPDFNELVISMIPIESAESRFCSVLLLCRN